MTIIENWETPRAPPRPVPLAVSSLAAGTHAAGANSRKRPAQPPASKAPAKRTREGDRPYGPKPSSFQAGSSRMLASALEQVGKQPRQLPLLHRSIASSSPAAPRSRFVQVESFGEHCGKDESWTEPTTPTPARASTLTSMKFAFAADREYMPQKQASPNREPGYYLKFLGWQEDDGNVETKLAADESGEVSYADDIADDTWLGASESEELFHADSRADDTWLHSTASMDESTTPKQDTDDGPALTMDSASTDFLFFVPTPKAPPPQPKKMPRSRKVPQVPSQDLDEAEPEACFGLPREGLSGTKACSSMPGLSFQESHAVAVLAYHTARLGPAAGLELETALKTAMTKADRKSVTCWGFLNRGDGEFALRYLQSFFSQIYWQYGKNAKSHAMICSMLPKVDIRTCSSESSLGWQRESTASGSPHSELHAPYGDGRPGQLLFLPILQVRFAHNDQSEHFAHASTAGRAKGSLLQLAVELLTGLTPLSSVPVFTVCRHEEQWYCRTGNRRLAALHLAARFAPDRFRRVQVQVVTKDNIFLHGAAGRSPKLTTSLNGSHCQGQWLVIRETGEVVGREGAKGDVREYAADFLELLPRLQSPGAVGH